MLICNIFNMLLINDFTLTVVNIFIGIDSNLKYYTYVILIIENYICYNWHIQIYT